MHADYGQGSFIGVDGAEHTTGDVWGHVLINGVALTPGEHEFESLVRPQPRSCPACAAQVCLTARLVPGLRGMLRRTR